ncbi:DUF1995 family protein [Geitlerinema sp. PCC 9228]|uniref:DUF1995 family protein n=1 Tax=Geitlerinema sp. PCC 9228 TaxID=111611 RepID=UPI0008F9890B|nr:DUF1995 family protein [Geitlerinema sp. PCC 9228]
MANLPTSLDEAIAQAQTATKAAVEDGYSRVQVELVFPELKIMPVAQKFLPLFEEYGRHLKIMFPDTGAAALAKRDWQDLPYRISDLGSERSPVDSRVEAEDAAYLLVQPSSVEVKQVEKLCELAADKLVVLLAPNLEDIATVGIGYAGRQLRERFLSTLLSCYYIKPISGAAIFRCYPSPWQVWRETETDYELMAEYPEKPTADQLEELFAPTASTSQSDASSQGDSPSGQTGKPAGVFGQLQRFLKALKN